MVCSEGADWHKFSAAFWMPADEVVHVICFRSHAQYVFTLLKVAAQKGSGLNVF